MPTLKEKAVDIALTVDMLRMAVANEYDTAYLLANDGDYTPLVKEVRDIGKKVFVVCPSYGNALAAVAYRFIQLPPEWFFDCYRQ